MSKNLRIFFAILWFFPQGIVSAHDIWLFPDRFTLAQGDTIRLRQLAGAELSAESLQVGAGLELPLLRRMTPRFELITSEKTIDLLAELPEERVRPIIKPVLQRQLNFNGLALFAMEHAFVHDEFPTEKFMEYFKHEALDGEKYRPYLGDRPNQRERYARAFKCLVQVGAAAQSEVYKKVLGQKIEILLLQNPYRLAPGDPLEVQILFAGKPLAEKFVMAYNADQNQTVSKIRARTDARGIARFELERAGFWLIRLVHLLPCVEREEMDCTEADWESYWSSYSFRLD